MSLPPPLALCLGGVFCCSPLALYFLWLASVNRRSRPTVVSGQWDFVAVLLGLVGFLGVGGAVVESATRAVFAARSGDSFATAGRTLDDTLTAGSWAGVVYWCVVTAGAAVGSWTRRDSLSVYDIDPSALPAAVESAAAAVGLAARPPALGWSQRPFLGHASVRVRRLHPAARSELLHELRTRLAAAPSGAGRAGGWFTVAAAALIGSSFLLIGFFLRQTRFV